MGLRNSVLMPALALALCAQDSSRKPSAFPEKNPKAKVPASRSGSKRPSARRPPPVSAGTAPAVEEATGGAPAETGKACFFSSSAAGGLTASGERLDAGALVAAHATYSLGSRVNVTNLANGKTVEVRIVDRFPSSKRIINLSEAAARQLGFVEAGTAEVRLTPVRQARGTASREAESK
jgi:rare lipoprotein A